MWSRGEYFDLLGDNHRGIVSNFRQPVEKFPNFMKNTTVKIGPKIPKYGIFMVEKFLTIVEYFLIFHKIFTPVIALSKNCKMMGIKLIHRGQFRH